MCLIIRDSSCLWEKKRPTIWEDHSWHSLLLHIEQVKNCFMNRLVFKWEICASPYAPRGAKKIDKMMSFQIWLICLHTKCKLNYHCYSCNSCMYDIWGLLLLFYQFKNSFNAFLCSLNHPHASVTLLIFTRQWGDQGIRMRWAKFGARWSWLALRLQLVKMTFLILSSPLVY